MKTQDEEIQSLTHQLNEWSIQIAAMAAIQKEAAASAALCAQQVSELRAKHLHAAKRMHALKSQEPTRDIWENIGCGG